MGQPTDEPLAYEGEDPVALGEDVAEACADALLTACMQAMVLQGRVTAEISEVRDFAMEMMNRIIDRTLRNGALPR